VTIRTGDNYDVFLSHASEDKTDVVGPLAEILQSRGARVWVDQQQLKLGDTLSAKIDEGLAESRFGVVILSPHFFAKPWPELELSGLVARETTFGVKVILPVWHNLTAEEIAAHSPTLAGKLAARTADGLEGVADQIMAVLNSTAAAPGQIVAGPSTSPNGSAEQTPAATHDQTEALLQVNDRVGLTKLLRVEQAEWEQAIGRSIGRVQPGSADSINSVFERLWPAAERRLASIVPLALHEPEIFDAETRSLARALERMPTTPAPVWKSVPQLATSAIVNMAGALLVDGERYSVAIRLLGQTWTDPGQCVTERLAVLPVPQHPVGIAIAPPAPEGHSWIAPFWTFLLTRPEHTAWLTERYPEFAEPDRYGAAIVGLDIIRCLLAGHTEQLGSAHFPLRMTDAEQFARSLVADHRRRSALAGALAIPPERFNMQAAQALRKCREIDYRHDPTTIAEIFEGRH
jgi:hypothetical protein